VIDGRCGLLLLLLEEEEDVREDRVKEEGMDGAWNARVGERAMVVKAAARKSAAVERVRAVVCDEEEEEEGGEEEEEKEEAKPTMTAQAAFRGREAAVPAPFLCGCACVLGGGEEEGVSAWGRNDDLMLAA